MHESLQVKPTSLRMNFMSQVGDVKNTTVQARRNCLVRAMREHINSVINLVNEEKHDDEKMTYMDTLVRKEK